MTNTDPRTQYSCPVCGGNENRYMTCEYAGCPDGRDRFHPHRFVRDAGGEMRTVGGMPYEHFTERTRGPTNIEGGKSMKVWPFIAIVALVLCFVLLAGRARAMDHGFDPNDKTVKWFEKLQRPDQPGSCCGKADGYPVSDYWANSDGSDTWTIVISDGSAKKYPDGTYRPYLGVKEIIVPNHLMNRLEDDLDNPTDTSWIFLSVYAGLPGVVYCVIRHPQGN